MKKIIKAGIIGGAGYTGGEMIRLLLYHPSVELTFIHSKSNSHKPLHHVHQDLIGQTDLHFSDQLNENVDVLFLCTGHGESKQFLEQYSFPQQLKIISLSQDFRLQENAKAGEREFVYGLPESNREQLRTAGNIANPGCFATAIQLGLLPLAKENLLSEVFTTGITGSTGAGQSLSASSHFSWRENNIQAYKTLSHQHLFEINETLEKLSGKRTSINFVPWRGDFTRGIFISSQVKMDKSLNDLTAIYKDFYSDHPFTIVSESPIFLKQVVNTNNCVIHLEKEGNTLVIHSAIDNLLKGASGQALQNMNLMFGLDECAGLRLKANYF